MIDSLKLALETRKTHDSIKVMILTRLHEKLMFSKPEEAKSYAEEELRISKKINYKKGLGVGYMHLGDYYSNRSENDSALYYHYKAKKYFKEINSQRGLIFVNHSLSSIQSIKGNYNKAIKLSEETLDLILKHEKEGDSKTKFIAAQYASLSNIYIEKGNYKIALTYSLKALKLFEEINHLTRKADVLKQLGDIESALGNNKTALQYYNVAMKIYQDFDDKMYMAYTANSMGIVYQDMKDYHNAKKHQILGVSLAREMNDNMALANALHNLGELYIIDKDYKKAQELLLEAKILSEKEDIRISTIYAYGGLSKIDKEQGRIYDALKKLDKAIEIAIDIESLPQLEDLYASRSLLLEDLNNNKGALFYLKASQNIADSLFSIKKSQQIEELKTIYETEKKETEIRLQSQEIKALNQEVEISNLRKSLYAGGMVSFVVLSGVLFFGFKQRIKKNKIEREKQEEIYKQEIEFKKERTYKPNVTFGSKKHIYPRTKR